MLFCFGTQTHDLERKVSIMKKILVMILTVAMIAAAFIGCADKPDKLPSDGFGLTSEDTNGNGLRDDVELEILKYVSDGKVDPDDWIIKYYGTYHGAVALSIIYKDSFSTGEVTYEIIAGYEFWIGGHSRIIVWHGGKTHTLKKAYDSGILTDEDVGAIHALRKK